MLSLYDINNIKSLYEKNKHSYYQIKPDDYQQIQNFLSKKNYSQYDLWYKLKDYGLMSHEMSKYDGELICVCYFKWIEYNKMPVPMIIDT